MHFSRVGTERMPQSLDGQSAPRGGIWGTLDVRHVVGSYASWASKPLWLKLL